MGFSLSILHAWRVGPSPVDRLAMFCSVAWLNDLVRAGKIKVATWDDRTLMHQKQSLEHYLETKQTKHRKTADTEEGDEHE
jgi:hypothetical protein